MVQHIESTKLKPLKSVCGKITHTIKILEKVVKLCPVYSFKNDIGAQNIQRVMKCTCTY
jgi:hypothetical protein